LWVWDGAKREYLRTTARLKGRTPGAAARKAVMRGARAFALIEATGATSATVFLYVGGTVDAPETVQVSGRVFTRRSKPVLRMWKKLSATTGNPQRAPAEIAQLLARYPVPDLP
jgi:hypothetical protein